MFINLTNIDFCPGSGGGSANLQENKSVTYTTNGNYTIQPDEGYDGLSSVGVDVSVSPNLQSKTSTYTSNGTYTIQPDTGYDGLSSVGVTVNYDGTDYRNQTGTVDFNGLREIGWDETSINYLNANALHYPWENDNYKVTDGNKALNGIVSYYTVVDYKGDPNFIYCPYFDMSDEMIYETRGLFGDISTLKSIPLLNTSNISDMDDTFSSCTSLETIPLLNTSNVSTMRNMFLNCSSLKSIPLIDTSRAMLMNNMFSGCISLQSIPLLNTSNAEDMSGMLRNCSSLKTIPLFNTSKVTDMTAMFMECSNLQSIPLLDTSKVTKMNSMFKSCTSLQTIPQLDTSSVTSMSEMFSECSNLQTIPQLNTSNVTSMSNMFYHCDRLRSIPQLDSSKVTSMYRMFDGWFNTMRLERVEGLDMSSATETSFMFRRCEYLSYIRLNGSLNVGLDISATSKLDYDSVKSILTAASNTVNTNSKTLSFNSTLTDQNGELATLVSTCTSKGWTINGLTLN